MKTLMKFILPLFALISLSLFASEKNDENEIDVFELIESKAYTFEASSLTSSKGFHRDLTSQYDLTVEGDSASAYLPFVGRAYSGAYGGDGGIEFDDEILEYSVELKEKKKAKNNVMYVTFKVKSDNDTFDCSLSIGNSGYATLNIYSTNRQNISFNGSIVPIEVEE